MSACPLCPGNDPACAFCGGVAVPEPAAARAAPESNPYRKFMTADHQTRSGAIKAMCAHCMGCTLESIEAGFRRMVSECGMTSCPLHKFRPYQRAADNDDD